MEKTGGGVERPHSKRGVARLRGQQGAEAQEETYTSWQVLAYDTQARFYM